MADFGGSEGGLNPLFIRLSRKNHLLKPPRCEEKDFEDMELESAENLP